MNSTPNSEQVDPSVISLAPGDERVVNDERTLRAELARVHERLSDVAQEAGTISLDPEVATFRPNATGGSTVGRAAVRGITGIFMIACIGGAAFAWQSSYGQTARAIVAELAPQLIPGSTTSASKSESRMQAVADPVQTASADATAPATADETAPQSTAAQQQLAPPAQQATAPAQGSTAQETTATAATSSPPDEQRLQQELTVAQQKIAELETSKQQLVRDNAAITAQLKAAQEQVARLTPKPPEPKVSETKPADPRALYAQALRPKPPAAPRRPVTTYARPVAATQPAMPRPLAPPPQAAAQPLAPAPLPAPIIQPSPDQVQMTSAPRPPMPVPQ